MSTLRIVFVSSSLRWICGIVSVCLFDVSPSDAAVMGYEFAGLMSVREIDLDSHFRTPAYGVKGSVDGESRIILNDGTSIRLPSDFSPNATFPLAWNSSGQIVGTTFSNANDRVGFFYENGKMTYLESMRNNMIQEVRAINEQGQAVGGGYGHEPFIYENGVRRDIRRPAGYLDGFANDINESGLIGGFFLNQKQNHRMPFLHFEGNTYDLSKISYGLDGYLLREVLAITDDDWILAHAHLPIGPDMFQSERIWLRPSDVSDARPTPVPMPVPEPASIVFWAGIATVLMSRRLRRSSATSGMKS